MSYEKEDLASKFIRDTYYTHESENTDKANNHSTDTYLDQKMAPAAFPDNTSDAGFALNYDPYPDTTLGAVGAAGFKDPLVIARATVRAMIEEHQRKHNNTEEKLVAIVRARQLEVRKEQELDLARAIRRHHEDEQIQKRLMSNYRERGLMKRDPELMTMAVSSGEDVIPRSEATSRKRRLEDGILLRSVLQRKQDQLTLLNDLRTATRRGNEDDTLFPRKISHHQNVISSGVSRLLPVTSHGNSSVSLPLSSLQTSFSQPLSLSSSSLSSRRPTYIEDQASSFAERLHPRNNSQFTPNDFRNDRSQAILNSLYSSTSGPISSNQDISSLRNYYNAVNASGRTGSGNLNNIMHVNMPTPGTNLPSIAHTGAGADWLRASNGVAAANSSLMRASSRQQEKHALDGRDDHSMHVSLPTPGANLPSIAHTGAGADWLRASNGVAANSSLMRASSRQQEKHALEGQDDILVDSKRIKKSDKITGVNDGNGMEQEAEQQQKRFNKHQCKQWTLKFHELLGFKEKMGHCNVPHGYKENLALAMWVKRQRHQYNLLVEKKTSTLTGERIKLLENIGFVWNCLETAWEQHFQDLRDYVMRTGHCAVPPTYKTNTRLASWVVTQRRQCKLLEDGKQSSMNPKRLEKLKQIGFPVKTKKASLANIFTK